MPSSAPFFREAGHGPNVVCLHSSAASSAQWRPLMDQLCDKYRVLAVDLYGEGKSPAWTSARDCTIDDELELLNPLLDECAPFILVGHSYGGAVAVRIALAKMQSVQALVLYEPALWGFLARVDPDAEGTKEIEAVRQSLIEQLDLGNDEAATQGFIDYWAGAGTWASLPEQRRPSLIQGAKANAKKWRESLGPPFSEEEILDEAGRASWRRGLIPPSRGRAPAGFACLRPPLMSNVRPQRKSSSFKGSECPKSIAVAVSVAKFASRSPVAPYKSWSATAPCASELQAARSRLSPSSQKRGLRCRASRSPAIATAQLIMGACCISAFAVPAATA